MALVKGCRSLFLWQREAVWTDVGVTAGIIPVGIAFINGILNADNLSLHIIFIIILSVVRYGNVKCLRPRPDNYLIVCNNFIPVGALLINAVRAFLWRLLRQKTLPEMAGIKHRAYHIHIVGKHFNFLPRARSGTVPSVRPVNID